jgi:hypothetical protein
MFSHGGNPLYRNTRLAVDILLDSKGLKGYKAAAVPYHVGGFGVLGSVRSGTNGSLVFLFGIDVLGGAGMLPLD